MTRKITSSRKMNKRAYIGALVLTALFIGGGAGVVFTYAATKSSVSDQATGQSSNSNYYTVGQTINKSGLAFSLNSVKVDAVGNTIFKPTDQSKFVIADVTITNNTTSQIPVVPVTQMYLKDADGQTYNISPAPVTSQLNAGNLPAGENLRGEISFEAPSRLSSMKLYYDSGWNNLTPSIYEFKL